MGNCEHIDAYGKSSINIVAFNSQSWVEQHLSNVLFISKINTIFSELVLY